LLSATQRKQRATIAAYARAARYDGPSVTKAARAAGDQRFITQAAAEAAERGERISEQELQRRALALRKLFYARMAFRSAKARAKKKTTNGVRSSGADALIAEHRNGEPEATFTGTASGSGLLREGKDAEPSCASAEV
jgi:hypothetical protein